jgi:type I restriction enzyme S subunit
VTVRELTLDKLGELSRGRSRHRPRDASSLYGGPFPFVQTGDVKRAGLYLTEYEQTYSEAGLAQSRLWPAGTLCITIAANIADTAILGIDACFPDSVIGFTADPEMADTRFVKYLFDAVLKIRFRSFTQGAAQDNLSQEKLLSIKFPVPDLRVQRRIADILSAYDDLIENNRRRIALLEEAARMLYREWFVHFRFPGHEHVKITDGLSEGWERKRIADACSFLGRGISPNYDDEGEYIVINQKCIRDRLLSLAPARRQTREYNEDRALKYLDVLINSTGTGTLGRVAQCWFEPEAMTFDSHVTVARPNGQVDPFWFGYALLELQKLFEGMGDGATNQKELSRTRIAETRLLAPPRPLQVLFADFA